MCQFTESVNLNGGGVFHGVLLKYVTCTDFDIVDIEGTRYVVTTGPTYNPYDYMDDFSLIDGMIRLSHTKMTEKDILRFFHTYKAIPEYFYPLKNQSSRKAHATFIAQSGFYRYPVSDFIDHVKVVRDMVDMLKVGDVGRAYERSHGSGFDFSIVLKKTDNGTWFLTPETSDLFSALEYQLLAANLNGPNGGLLRFCTNCGTPFMVRLSNDGASRTRRPRNIVGGGTDPTFCSDKCRVAYNRKKNKGESNGKEK